ncbi:MAG: glycosyltransferase family 2 protein [Aquabacterium sp.]|nr:glycosyltransferase family 2 protein [Aquabacterium sp.]
MMLTLTLLAAALLVLPAASLLMLVLASLRRTHPPLPATGSAGPRPPVAVLVPAHNESVHLLPTLACLQQQLAPGDRLVVIADNCNDDTASVARTAGALVLERHDTALRGKGYALAHGVDALRGTPPAVVMVVDADCTLSANGVDAAVRACATSGRPVQLLNLMACQPGASVKHRLLEFAMRVKNHARTLGAARLGGACHLMGTGMALPWGLASTAELATGHIAEDMRLGTDLALAGHTTLFVPQGRVHSQFPLQASDAHVQKSRWEHGHLATLREQLPRLLGAGLRSRSKSLLVLALDLCIPPLALYVLVVLAALGACLLTALVWPVLWPATAVLGLGAGAVASAVLLCWHRFARDLLSAKDLLSALGYVLWKAPIYLAYVFNKRSGWVRAKRSEGTPS